MNGRPVKRDWVLAAAACGAVLGALAVAGGAGADDGFAWRSPQGAPPPPVPADNPMSQAKVELGRRLFYDADLSIDGTVACGTCHEQRRAFAEGNATKFNDFQISSDSVLSWVSRSISFCFLTSSSSSTTFWTTNSD